MSVIKILAEELRPGDMWIGETTEIYVVGLKVQDGWRFIPWEKGRTDPPIEMKAIIISGNKFEYDGAVRRLVHTGMWTLQEDQPLEVLRGS